MHKTRYILLYLLQQLLGFSIICLMLLLGKSLSILTNELLPAAIIGMLLLTLSLSVGLIQLRWVKGISKVFEHWMSLLFIPIGVGLVEYIHQLQQLLAVMATTCIAATLLLLALVGHSYQWLLRRTNTDND